MFLVQIDQPAYLQRLEQIDQLPQCLDLHWLKYLVTGAAYSESIYLTRPAVSPRAMDYMTQREIRRNEPSDLFCSFVKGWPLINNLGIEIFFIHQAIKPFLLFSLK